MNAPLRAYPIEASEVDSAKERAGHGARVGRVVRIEESGLVLVNFPGNPNGPVRARLALPSRDRERFESNCMDQEILLVFDNNDASRPIVIGLVSDKLEAVAQPELEFRAVSRDVVVNGKRLVFSSEDEISLSCGRSSIVLGRDGKIVIRGKDVLTRASHHNRIKGSSVKIN